MIEIFADTDLATRTAWKALRYFNLYRVTLAGLFVTLVWTGNVPPPLGAYDPHLFNGCSFFYLSAALLAHAAIEYRKFPYSLQVVGQVLLDIAILTLMLYASGGVGSGFGMMLVISITGGGLLTRGRIAMLFAAVSTIALLLEELYAWSNFPTPVANFTQVGLLSVVLFVSAFLAHVFAGRIRESEALVARREVDLANLSRLNEHIVQRMQSGILVLDEHGAVVLANQSAIELLDAPEPVAGQPLSKIAGELNNKLDDWIRLGSPWTDLVYSSPGGNELHASFSELGTGTAGRTLIFLEDAAKIRQRAQHLKLASLGRLTGSIAHEIRNPLGAISHAGQLLSESRTITEEDKRMTRIIKQHSERVNTIIENIMQISRRGHAVPEAFTIRTWLKSFVEEFSLRYQLDYGSVVLSVEPEHVQVRMDRSQLQQVLLNLCENGLRYSRGRPLLELRCGIGEIGQRPYLDVIDNGPGIAHEVVDSIFEPFYTTDPNGTGLGLYIASELCEANQASLRLHANSNAGCCFRVNFAHPERQQLIA